MLFVFLLMAILSQSFFTFMSCNLMTFSFFTARHVKNLNDLKIYFNVCILLSISAIISGLPIYCLLASYHFIAWGFSPFLSYASASVKIASVLLGVKLTTFNNRS